MTDVTITPRVRCDNCGTTVDKVPEPYSQGGNFVRPSDWGTVRGDPTHHGTYPNNIGMADLCPRCLRFVHEAIGNALAQGRKVPKATSDMTRLEYRRSLGLPTTAGFRGMEEGDEPQAD